ncbi:MAG: hypothetical protein QME90_08630 [Thermodesulfobacteriota bacterium]|nr:hypothetical protein [Thermodesulfobacteriota bacterium]
MRIMSVLQLSHLKAGVFSPQEEGSATSNSKPLVIFFPDIS